LIPHIPVLLNETVALFEDMSDGYFIDCTCGFGGHSEAILQHYPNVKLIAIDQDSDALDFAKQRLSKYADRITFVNKRASDALGEFANLPISGILADIGVSSYQLDEDARGFNFNSDTLDMRMNQKQEFSAYDVVNYYSKEQLERIFKEFADERFYKKIAQAIVTARKHKKFTSSKELAEFIATLIPKGKIHPATKAFQAIRIEVNNELEELHKLLDATLKISNKGTIVGVITFHSLEDRIVKNTFKQWQQRCICPPEAMRCECGRDNHKGYVLTKKPITASKEEVLANPRSRSAKLRGFRFR